ncbi:MAG: SCP2 sterol-binding domain-containing protein [Firmicutes bacterium]|nr:SCP2 sterol-binding domain-containing protein [Bacillota bacterium]
MPPEEKKGEYTAVSLGEVLEQFARACNANARLQAMNKDWNRVIHITAVDTQKTYGLTSQNGQIAATGEAVGAPDLEIEADAAVLQAVFSGKLAPVEPYNAGDLIVHGSSEDLLRLDILTMLIWGE